MPIYSMGEIIKSCRKKKGIAQVDLCEGICSVPSLSRIENGKQEALYVTFSSLMERMGEWPGSYDYYLGGEVFEIQQLMQKITALGADRHYEEGLEALDELEKLLEGIDKKDADKKNADKKNTDSCRVYQQFLQTHRIVYQSRMYVNREQLQQLIDLLRWTVPSYGKKPIEQLFLTLQEVIILNDIAVGYGENNEIDKCIEILEALRKYLDQPFIGYRMKQHSYVAIMRNLVKYYGLKGDHEKAILTSHDALKEMRNLGMLKLVSDMYYSIAWNYIQMGKVQYRQEIEDMLFLSLAHDIACKNFENADDIIWHIKKNMPEILNEPSLVHVLDLYRRAVQYPQSFPTQKSHSGNPGKHRQKTKDRKAPKQES